MEGFGALGRQLWPKLYYKTIWLRVGTLLQTKLPSLGYPTLSSLFRFPFYPLMDALGKAVSAEESLESLKNYG